MSAQELVSSGFLTLFSFWPVPHTHNEPRHLRKAPKSAPLHESPNASAAHCASDEVNWMVGNFFEFHDSLGNLCHPPTKDAFLVSHVQGTTKPKRVNFHSGSSKTVFCFAWNLEFLSVPTRANRGQLRQLIPRGCVASLLVLGLSRGTILGQLRLADSAMCVASHITNSHVSPRWDAVPASLAGYAASVIEHQKFWSPRGNYKISGARGAMLQSARDWYFHR